MASTTRDRSRLSDPWFIFAGLTLLACVVGIAYGVYVAANRPAQSSEGLGASIPQSRQYDYLNVSIIGDSYTDGAGVNNRGLAYTSRAAQSQCWEVNRVAQSGTGYTNPGSRDDSRPYTDPARIRAALATNPQLIIVQGSISDEKRAGLRDAALTVFTALRAQAPRETKVVAVGPTTPPDADPAAIGDVRDEIASAADEAGVPFIDPIQRGWLRDPGAYTPDGLYLNESGHLQFANDLVQALLETDLVVGDSCAPIPAS